MTTQKTTTRRRKTAASKTHLTARKRAEPPSAEEETALAAVIAAETQRAAEDDIDSGDAPAPGVLEINIEALPEMKKRDLIEAAVARSGIRRRDAKPAVEAALAILGEALAEGRELNMMPLGKVKVTRMKKAGNGLIVHTRVRQPEEAENTLPNPLAQAAE